MENENSKLCKPKIKNRTFKPKTEQVS